MTPLQDAYITLEFERETDGRWIAEFPHAPGCLAYGQTLREAAVNAMNLLENAGESSVLREAATPTEMEAVQSGMIQIEYCSMTWADADWRPSIHS